MPRKPGSARTKYNNAWNKKHPVAAAAHRVKANRKYMGELGSPERAVYNATRARLRREARARKKKAAAVAARLLALAAERARGAGYGYVGAIKPNHF